MSAQLEHAHATYAPQLHKSFEGALESFFCHECPQIGGLRTRQVLVQSITEIVRAFFPSTSHLGAGQIVWTAVHKDEKASYGKSIAQSQLTPVVLDLLPPSEIKARAEGAKLRPLKIEAVARLFTQAFEQNGVLTNAEVALFLKTSPGTVSKYLKEYEQAHATQLPRRGTIHDMGPTLTHKREIIAKLLFEGKSVEVTCRETDHSPEAVLRYSTNFRQVLLCQQRGLSEADTAFATKLSLRLVQEYWRLIADYQKEHPAWKEQSGQPWLAALLSTLDAVALQAKNSTSKNPPTT